MIYKLAYNATTKVAQLLPNTYTNLPVGSTLVGTFHHDNDIDDEEGFDVSHVIYQHVQDLLYGIGVQDMQSVKILYNTAVTGITVTPDTVTLAPAATQQLTAVVTPADASAPLVIWTTSDATKATVSSTGLVTAVATGSATITGTVNGGFTDTCVVTIS